ncbi:unnamed protein product [Leuciscus chuanchicus]
MDLKRDLEKNQRLTFLIWRMIVSPRVRNYVDYSTKQKYCVSFLISELFDFEGITAQVKQTSTVKFCPLGLPGDTHVPFHSDLACRSQRTGHLESRQDSQGIYVAGSTFRSTVSTVQICPTPSLFL